VCRDVVPPILLDDSNCQQNLRLTSTMSCDAGYAPTFGSWFPFQVVVLKALNMYLRLLGFMVMKFACVI